MSISIPLLFDLPVELRSIIFEELSLRDISRLRQSCSSFKNKLEDLSFLKVLDFSYSPDITDEAFRHLLHNRINNARNNIVKVIIAHTRKLTVSSLELLFETLPRIKDIRIRYCLPSHCLTVLLKQENLEGITFKYDNFESIAVGLPDSLEIKCRKLTRFKCQIETEFGSDFTSTLLEMNPALRNDTHFLDLDKILVVEHDLYPNCLKKIRKRPFYRGAREYYLNKQIRKLQQLAVSNQQGNQFEQKLTKVMKSVSSILKRMPRRIRIMRANLDIRQGKYQQAYDMFFGIIDPNYVLHLDGNWIDDCNAQALLGAYHMANDYLNSSELLRKLESFNPESYKFIVQHFAKFQKNYEEGTCARLVFRYNRANQYWYECYTCNLDDVLCYPCAKTCHVKHDVVYVQTRPANCHCVSMHSKTGTKNKNGNLIV
jgi:hypothetical protein